jgi:hypothetical protein
MSFEINASDIAASLEDVLAPAVKLENAPTTLEDAIERIRVLEQALDNVCYTMEIASVTKDYSHARPYVDEGLELLQNRIVEIEPDAPEMKITIVEGKLNADDVKNIVSKRAASDE